MDVLVSSCDLTFQPSCAGSHWHGLCDREEAGEMSQALPVLPLCAGGRRAVGGQGRGGGPPAGLLRAHPELLPAAQSGPTKRAQLEPLPALRLIVGCKWVVAGREVWQEACVYCDWDSGRVASTSSQWTKLPVQQIHWWFYSAMFGALFFALKYISGGRCLFNALHLRLLFHSWLISLNICVCKSFLSCCTRFWLFI